MRAGLGFERAAKRGIGRYARHVPAFDNRVDIERRAADQDWEPAPVHNCRNGFQRQILIASEAHVAVRRQDVDEVMRNAPSLVAARFGDPDVEPSIEVARIGVDDFTSEFLGEGNAECGLADSGRTGNHDDSWTRFWPLHSVLTLVRLVDPRCHGSHYDARLRLKSEACQSGWISLSSRAELPASSPQQSGAMRRGVTREGRDVP